MQFMLMKNASFFRCVNLFLIVLGIMGLFPTRDCVHFPLPPISLFLFLEKENGGPGDFTSFIGIVLKQCSSLSHVRQFNENLSSISLVKDKIVISFFLSSSFWLEILDNIYRNNIWHY